MVNICDTVFVSLTCSTTHISHALVFIKLILIRSDVVRCVNEKLKAARAFGRIKTRSHDNRTKRLADVDAGDRIKSEIVPAASREAQ